MPKRYMISGVPLSVLGLAVINTAIEFVLWASDAGAIAPNLRNMAYRYGAFWLSMLHGAVPMYRGQPEAMFVTYAFLHGGPVHLVVNMLALFSFGTVIVQRISQKRFLLAYLVCAISGGIGFALFSDNRLPMVGASGALFGLLGIWICCDYLDRLHYGDPLWVTARAVVVLILYNLVSWLLLSGNLAWEAHLGGFVSGWLLAIWWGRQLLPESRRQRRNVPPNRRNET